jgi:hypothetical protein
MAVKNIMDWCIEKVCMPELFVYVCTCVWYGYLNCLCMVSIYVCMYVWNIMDMGVEKVCMPELFMYVYAMYMSMCVCVYIYIYIYIYIYAGSVYQECLPH